MSTPTLVHPYWVGLSLDSRTLGQVHLKGAWYPSKQLRENTASGSSHILVPGTGQAIPTTDKFCIQLTRLSTSLVTPGRGTQYNSDYCTIASNDDYCIIASSDDYCIIASNDDYCIIASNDRQSGYCTLLQAPGTD